MPALLTIPFDNAYARLPDQCYARVLPTPVANPALIRFNHGLAAELGIDVNGSTEAELAAVFAGNDIPAGADPLAMAYSGHQFGHLNPQLGDGRAILLGDVVDIHGQRRDIQLKGSGRTPFSRNGDGRSPLGPVLREYILCEAMHALGVPTTRALAAVNSGEWVYREGREPGAVFTRVAASHIRVGTFQYFALRRDHEALQQLADHVIERHYPHIDTTAADKYRQLFESICKNQAQLIAQWMQLGFIHGVMNTDNMTVSGEAIDYGPCAFMDAYHPDTVFSSIDRQGRYAYSNQPAIGQWNLARLAEALLPLINSDEKTAVAQATEILQEYPRWQQDAWLQHMAEKFGFSQVQETDQALIEQLLKLMEQSRLDYSLFFRRLSHCTQAGDNRTELLALLQLPECRPTAALEQQLNNWLNQWQQQLTERGDSHSAAQRMQAKNPAVIPRNHRVAEAIAAAEAGDYSVFERLLSALEQPYEERPEYAGFMQPPQPAEKVLKTFCGT
ncbi:protein adenylyltransferase SelO [Venatoribacter cucullus]|uniref:protein adenylyltransferase SelO n=1 Tax=Venatoribacter cucullus TaxID=2661630 RepID=UPI00223EE12A|nr:YdiU family protein [Venatoribacter cucullus]UZK04445.1 YdiU family protein [Venatoribacter cucullus]